MKLRSLFFAKRWPRSTLLFAVAVLALVSSSSRRVSTQSLTPFYHWAYPSGGDQLYTIDSNSPGPGWNYIEITGYVYTSQVSGTVPLYRFSGSGDHYYTISSPDPPPGYTYEGVAAYVFNPQVVGTVPLYRYFSCCGEIAVSHYYTTQEGGPGYPWTVYEGIEGYISPP